MGIIDALRSKIYGSFFGPENPVSTQHGYAVILESIPDGASVLDIGCGDGIYFTNPKVIETIKRKKLNIYAIDIDAGAVEICTKRVASAALGAWVKTKAISVTDIKDKYDYVLWMESFPVISPDLFEILFKHSLTITKKKTMLYHNLVADNEATPFFRWIKPIIGYFTLCDFGKMTTQTEMRQTMQSLTPWSFTIKPLLSCQLAEMHITGWMAAVLLNRFKSRAGDRKIVQYLVSVDVPGSS